MAKKRGRVRVIILTLVGALILTGMVFYMYPFSKPLLRVTTGTQGALGILAVPFGGGKTIQYTVYSDGTLRRKSFRPSEVESYSIENTKHSDARPTRSGEDELKIYKAGIEIQNRDYKRLYEIVSNTIDLVNAHDIIRGRAGVGSLYILDERCFFVVFNVDRTRSDPMTVIFEYLPEENSIVVVAQFKGKYVDHVELY